MERSTLTPETVKRSALHLGRLERSPARLRRRSSIDGRFGPRSTGRGTGDPRIKTVLAHTGTSLVWEAISTAQESGRGKIFAPNQKPFFARKNFDSSRLTADTLPPTLNRRYLTAMTDTETTIQIDAKTQAIRSGNRWALLRRLPDGTYDTERTWTGGRRSLLQYLDEQGIVPTRDAEAQLAGIAESSGFRER